MGVVHWSGADLEDPELEDLCLTPREWVDDELASNLESWAPRGDRRE